MEHGDRPEDESEEGGYPRAPLPPHERTWRHPSELGTGQMAVVEPAAEPGPVLSKSLAAGAALVSLMLVLALTRLMLPGEADDDRSAVVATSSAVGARASLVATTLLSSTVPVSITSVVTVATPAATQPPSTEQVVPATTDTAPAASLATTTQPPTTQDLPTTTSQLVTTSAAPTSQPPVEPTVITVPDPPVDAPAVALIAVGTRPAFAVEVQERSVYVTTSAAVGTASALPMELADGSEVQVEVVMVDDRAGIAVLEVSDSAPHDRPQALQSADPAAPGETVTVLDKHTEEPVVGVIGEETTGEGARELLADQPIGEGAPVLDESGDLVGLCTASGEKNWVVPADAVNAAIEASAALTASEAWLGVTGERADGGGVLVVSVVSGSPAESGGVVVGDVVVGLGDSTVLSLPDLALDLSEHQPGDDVELRVVRDGGELVLPVVLAERPA